MFAKSVTENIIAVPISSTCAFLWICSFKKYDMKKTLKNLMFNINTVRVKSNKTKKDLSTHKIVIKKTNK